MLKNLSIFGLLFLATQSAFAESDNPPTTGIVIATQGIIAAAPAIATISAGVVTEGKTADEALSKNRPSMNALADAAMKFGVESRDIQTSELTIRPQFTQSPMSPNAPRPSPTIDRYQARINVTIIVRDLTKVGPLVDQLVKSGSNAVNGVSFGLADPDRVKNQAREKAAEEARRRAQMYASALGVKLGALLSVSEPEAEPFVGGEVAADMPSQRRASPGTPPLVVQPGEITVRASLRTVWKIEQ